MRANDIDLEEHTIRFRTLKRRLEHWRQVPVPAAHVRELELVHQLRALQNTHRANRLWPIGHRRFAPHRPIQGECGAAFGAGHRLGGPKRLCARYWHLYHAGQVKCVVTTAVAREPVGFLWAIACEVMGRPHATRAVS